MTLKIYEYKNCSTCQKAIKFLDQKGIPYQRVPIIDQPPSPNELRRMLTHLKESGGNLKNLFNTSGQQYRELGISEKLNTGMSEEEAIKLLSKNGKLIKRPFVLTEKKGTVGFKEETWTSLFK